VSILSAYGVRIEDISDLVGHSGTTVTETVYRHEIRPALTTGATAMDKILTQKRSPARLPPGEPVTPRLPLTQPSAAQARHPTGNTGQAASPKARVADHPPRTHGSAVAPRLAPEDRKGAWAGTQYHF